MVVVLIIGILLSIGIPTFFGARNRPHDTAAQANLRIAVNTATAIILTDPDPSLSDADAAALSAAEPALTFLPNGSASTGSNEISVDASADDRGLPPCGPGPTHASRQKSRSLARRAVRLPVSKAPAPEQHSGERCLHERRFDVERQADRQLRRRQADRLNLRQLLPLGLARRSICGIRPRKQQRDRRDPPVEPGRLLPGPNEEHVDLRERLADFD